jgi:hypothetical protein
MGPIGEWQGAEAKYLPAYNIMKIRPGTTDGSTVVHELVHAVDDFKGWYIHPFKSDYPSAEGLAYTVQELLSGAESLGKLDNVQVTKTCKKAQIAWDVAWHQFNGIFGSDIMVGGNSVRKINATDVNNVGTKLGLKFSCSQLKPLYEDMLYKRGIYGGCDDSEYIGPPAPCCLSCNFKWGPLNPVFE